MKNNFTRKFVATSLLCGALGLCTYLTLNLNSQKEQVHTVKGESEIYLTDILPSDFPTSEENAWENGEGCICYLDSSLLFVDDAGGELTLDTSTKLNQTDGNYTYGVGVMAPYNLLFSMEDGVLTSITFNAVIENKQSFAGTYSHVHKLAVTHSKVDATCTIEGSEAYYECECGECFSDEDLTEIISDLSGWLSEGGDGYLAPGHVIKTVTGAGATCTSTGIMDCYKCSVCGKYYSDPDGEFEIDYDEWTTSSGVYGPFAHELQLVSGKAASCDLDGWKDYYQCLHCGEYFEDAEGESCIGDDSDLTMWSFGKGKIAKHHNENLVKTEAVKETCTKNGCKAYWYCPDCETYYADEALTEANKIGDSAALTAWKANPSGGLIPATGHGGVKQDGKAATPSEDGYKEYYLCEGCGKYFEDEACTIEIQDLEAWKLNEGKIEKSGLTGGAIAGIVVGSTVVAAAGGFSIFWFPIKRRTWAELVEAIKKLGKTVVGKIKKE